MGKREGEHKAEVEVGFQCMDNKDSVLGSWVLPALDLELLTTLSSSLREKVFAFVTAEAGAVAKYTIRSKGLNRAQDLSEVDKFKGSIFVKCLDK